MSRVFFGVVTLVIASFVMACGEAANNANVVGNNSRRTRPANATTPAPAGSPVASPPANANTNVNKESVRKLKEAETVLDDAPPAKAVPSPKKKG